MHEKLLTTQMEVASRDDHLKKVAERQKLAEEQIKKLEAELFEAQQRKEEEVRAALHYRVDHYSCSIYSYCTLTSY